MPRGCDQGEQIMKITLDGASCRRFPNRTPDPRAETRWFLAGVLAMTLAILALPAVCVMVAGVFGP